MGSYAKNLNDVAKQVASKLGQPRREVKDIESPTTSLEEKLDGEMLYSIEQVQDEFRWKELLIPKQINPDPEQHFDGRYRYREPEDCIHFVGFRQNLPLGGQQTWFDALLRDQQGTSQFVDHDVEDGFYIGPSDSLTMVYVRRSLNPSEWSPQLFRAIVALWASEACYNVTQDADLTRLLADKYEGLVKPFAKWRQTKSNKRGGGQRNPGHFNLVR